MRIQVTGIASCRRVVVLAMCTVVPAVAQAQTEPGPAAPVSASEPVQSPPTASVAPAPVLASPAPVVAPAPVAAWLPAPPPVAAPPRHEGYRGEAGIHAAIDASGSGDKAIGPTVRFYFSEVPMEGRPAPEAAFLAHSGSAEGSFTASAGQGKTTSSSTESVKSGGLGFDVSLRFVGKTIPFTLRVPFATQAYYWPDSGDDAVMNSYSAGVEPGYYVRPDTEISAGFQMGWANLFYSGNSSSYSYLGWDLKMFWVRGRSVLDLGGGRWLAMQATLSRLGDQQENKLYGAAFDGRYYLAPWIGLGPRVSYSTYSGPNNEWAVTVKAMGVLSLGASVAVDLDHSRWGLIGAIEHQIPEESTADARTMASFEAVARF